MTTLLDTPTVGLEDLQRQAFYVFFKDFNDVLSQMADYWLPRDQEFDSVTGRTTAPTDLESIPDNNFFEGHKPSLLLNEPDGYPNLTVFANRADPSVENAALDHIDSWSDSLLVEIMVKALDEETVNRRIQRTSEAAIILVRSNPTLGGAVTGLETIPSIAISDVFAVRTDASKGGYPSQTLGGGQRYIWQGSAISFKIRKDAVYPSSLSDVFGGSSNTDFYSEIDQG